MAQIVRAVGIDTGKHHLDCKRRPQGDTLRVSNEPAGWAELALWIGEPHGVVIGIEASGGYERGVVAHLLAMGYEIRVLDPLRVKKYREAIGRRAKNDVIDTDAIMAFVASCDLAAKLPQRDRDRIAQWLSVRDTLMSGRIRLQSNLEHLTDTKLKRRTMTLISRADRDIDHLDEQIARLIDANEGFRQLRRLLTSCKGVGPRTVAVLIARLPELGSLDRHKIAALVGVAPFDDDSAERHGKRAIAGGRAAVRRALYMAALVAACFNPVIKAFYKRLRARGKEPKVALTACMRKLITILNKMVASATEWQPNPSKRQPSGRHIVPTAC